MSALTRVEAAGGHHFPNFRIPLRAGIEAIGRIYVRVLRSPPDPNANLKIMLQREAREANREWHERIKSQGEENLWDPLWPSIKALSRLSIAPIAWLRELIDTPNISDYNS